MERTTDKTKQPITLGEHRENRIPKTPITLGEHKRLIEQKKQEIVGKNGQS